MEPVNRVIQKFPLEALFVGFSPVGKHTMLTVANAVGPERIGVDNALAAARARTTEGMEKARKLDRVRLKPKVALSKKAKSAVAKKASTRTFQKSLSNLVERAHKLRSAANEVKADSAAFRGREVSTSNPETAAVRVDSGQATGAFDLKVDKVAKAQENHGSSVTRNTVDEFDSGRQFFEVKMGDEAARLSVAIAPSERSEISLQKIAKSVNSSGLALNANVMIDGDAESATLTLKATQTGDNAEFSVRDVVGSLVAKSGIDKVAQDAQNAEFSLNGNQIESQGNEFVVDGGRISVGIREAGHTEINVFRDQASMLGAVDNLVGEINQFRDSLSRSRETINEDIAVEFDRHLEELALELESLGVSMEMGAPVGNSAVTLDNSTLGQAAETQPAELELALAGPDGLAGRMEGFAQVVEQASAVELVALTEAEMSDSGAASQDSGSSGGVVNDAV